MVARRSAVSTPVTASNAMTAISATAAPITSERRLAGSGFGTWLALGGRFFRPTA